MGGFPLPLSRVLVVVITISAVLLVDFWLRGALHLGELDRLGRSRRASHRTSARSSLSESKDPSETPGQTPRWQLPEDLRRQIVAAIPLGGASPEGRVRATRPWRRGIRAAFVSDAAVSLQMRLEGGVHGEDFVAVNASEVPYGHFGKAALAPSLAHEHFGQYNYKWMLYGDDDTFWNLDVVADIVKGLDPDMPHFITDHAWFWGNSSMHKSTFHPSADAPRCVPCGFDRARLAGRALPFTPPSACPYCTWQQLCAADAGRRSLYAADCGFRQVLPPEGEHVGHGGAGILLSVGLMRNMGVDAVRRCMGSRFPPGVPGGDTLFSHCAFFTGVAPTDPGYSFLDTDFNAFDNRGQQVRGAMDLLYSFLKRGACCNALCRARLAATATVHVRGGHFKAPHLAADTIAALARLRDLYLDARAREEADPEAAKAYAQAGGVWDTHRSCD